MFKWFLYAALIISLPLLAGLGLSYAHCYGLQLSVGSCAPMGQNTPDPNAPPLDGFARDSFAPDALAGNDRASAPPQPAPQPAPPDLAAVPLPAAAASPASFPAMAPPLVPQAQTASALPSAATSPPSALPPDAKSLRPPLRPRANDFAKISAPVDTMAEQLAPPDNALPQSPLALAPPLGTPYPQAKPLDLVVPGYLVGVYR